MQIILASEELGVCENPVTKHFGVMVNGKVVDWRNSYKDAVTLFRDLYISRLSSDDPMIGSVKFYPTDLGTGQLGVVVASIEHGYVVQPLGTNTRLTLSSDLLSTPPPQGEN